jgi:hypothetical protein
MESKEFKGIKVTDQYGETLTVIEINDNIARVAKGMDNLYHVSNIFYKGKSVYNWLNEETK